MSNELGNEMGNNRGWRECCSSNRQVTKVAHYYLSVDAMTGPMQVREDSPPYGRTHP